MEITQLVTYLLDFGGLGVFCAFLVWSYIASSKRLDRQTEAMTTQLEALSSRFEAREQAIRDRYEGQIERERASKELLMSDVVTRLASQEQQVREAMARLDAALAVMRGEITELKLEMARLTAVDSVSAGRR